MDFWSYVGAPVIDDEITLWKTHGATSEVSGDRCTISLNASQVYSVTTENSANVVKAASPR